MEIRETLKDLGMSKQEVEIYLSLLENSCALASKISKETNIDRSLVYKLLEKLSKRGIVSYVIKENKRYYRAIKPEKFLDILKEKKENLRTILPKLASLIKPSEEKPVVEILEGKEGIKTILKDILKTKKEWLAFGSSGKAPEILPYYVEPWEKERQKHKIILKAIFDSSASGKKRAKELSKVKFTEVKYILEEYSSPTSTWIYKDRFVLIVWSKKHPFAIRTISEEISTIYKEHFKKLWKLAKS